MSVEHALFPHPRGVNFFAHTRLGIADRLAPEWW